MRASGTWTTTATACRTACGSIWGCRSVRPADGRLYKPLFAILCVDLDGRLNLNAHGSLAQADANYGTLVFNGQFAGGVTPTTLGRGQGLGPAEINLSGILVDQSSTTLLVGNATYEGRYGSPATGGTPTARGRVLPRWTRSPRTNGSSTAATIRDFTTNPAVDNAGSYGTPPDPFGVGAVGLDLAGRPIYAGMNYTGPATGYQSGTGYQNSTTPSALGMGSDIADATHLMNLPYAMNLGRNTSRGLSSPSGPDNPFSPAELERVLRPYDRDAPTLPARLANLTRRRAFGRTPYCSAERSKRNHGELGRAVSGHARPCRGSPAGTSPTDCQSLICWSRRGVTRHGDRLLPTLLPPDLLAGLKMNINRPFGNGRDYITISGDDAVFAGVIDAPIPIPPASFPTILRKHSTR